MATQHFKRNRLLNLYREGKTYLWFASSCQFKREKCLALAASFLHLETPGLPACYPLIAITVNKRIQNTLLGRNLKDNRMICSFPRQTIQYHSNPSKWMFRADLLLDWLVWSPCSPGILKSLLQHCSSKASILWHSAFSMAFHCDGTLVLRRVLWSYISLCVIQTRGWDG